MSERAMASGFLSPRTHEKPLILELLHEILLPLLALIGHALVDLGLAVPGVLDGLILRELGDLQRLFERDGLEGQVRSRRTSALALPEDLLGRESGLIGGHDLDLILLEPDDVAAVLY